MPAAAELDSLILEMSSTSSTPLPSLVAVAEGLFFNFFRLKWTQQHTRGTIRSAARTRTIITVPQAGNLEEESDEWVAESM